MKYSKEDLENFKLSALKKLATDNKIILPEKVKKSTIIDLLLNPSKAVYTITEVTYLKIEGDSLQYKELIKGFEGSIWFPNGNSGGFWLVPSEYREKLENGIKKIDSGIKEVEVEIVSEENSEDTEKVNKKLTGKDVDGNIITLEVIGDEIAIEGKSFKIKDKIKDCGGKWNASKKYWAVKTSVTDIEKLFSNIGLNRMK